MVASRLLALLSAALLAPFETIGVSGLSLDRVAPQQLLPESKASKMPTQFEETGYPIPAIIQEMFAGSNPNGVDRVVLESMDSRVDRDALERVIVAYERELNKKKAADVEVVGKDGRSTTVSEFKMYHECIILPKGKSRAKDDGCMTADGASITGGTLLSTIALQALSGEAGLEGALGTVRYIVKKMTDVDPEQQNEFTYNDLRELRLKEATEMVPGSGKPVLYASELAQRMQALCRKCIQGTLEDLASLGFDHPDQEKVQRLSEDVDKWAITLRCASQDDFPDCLPVEIYRTYERQKLVYECKEQGSTEGCPVDLEEEDPEQTHAQCRNDVAMQKHIDSKSARKKVGDDAGYVEAKDKSRALEKKAATPKFK